MGDEFEAGICGGNYNSNNNFWWINNNNNNMMMMDSATTRSGFPLMMSSSPCSVLTPNTDLPGGMIGYNSWQSDTVDLKAPMSTTTSSCSDISLGFLDATTATATKPLLQAAEAEAAADNNNHHNNGSILMDSSLDMNMIMAWNNSLFGTSSSSPSQDQKREISTKKNQDLCGGNNFSSLGSYDYPCVNNSSSSSSTLIQSLYEIPHPQPQQSSLFTTNPSASMAYSSIITPNNNFGPISNSSTDHQFTTTTATSSSSPSSWSRPSNNNNNNSTFLKSNGGGLQFSNCTPYWNASVETPYVFAPSLISDKPNFTSSLVSKSKREEASDTAKKASCEPAIKKQRIETPSPLPTFKVRKEKLGDRITALQQLVSPFGKTDTASVLHEAIEYIKFLHDQVLSTPYMKNGVPIQHCQQGSGVKDSFEGPKQDLRSRGLCLVPISSTFPVTNETPVDFWTPSFGGTLIR